MCIYNIIYLFHFILNSRNVTSQWLSPKEFSFHAEIDLDGTFLAANLYELYYYYYYL